jgi:hypothetical protein
VRERVRRYASRASSHGTPSAAIASSTVGCHASRCGQNPRSLASRVSRGARLRSMTCQLPVPGVAPSTYSRQSAPARPSRSLPAIASG